MGELLELQGEASTDTIAGFVNRVAEECSRAGADEEKRHRVFDEIAARRRVSVAEDFVLGAPGAPATGQTVKPAAPTPAKPRAAGARPGRN